MPIYSRAFKVPLKKLHEQGCPYTWEEPIPKV